MTIKCSPLLPVRKCLYFVAVNKLKAAKNDGDIDLSSDYFKQVAMI